MTRRLALAAGALAFVLLATANAGGYRFGVSDQAFYIPAVAKAADATLFPRDTAVLAPQMRLWLGDELLGAVLRAGPLEMPALFAVLYVAGLLLLFSGAVFLARGLGASWWAVAAATTLLTFRHQITKTGANSLEGYLHPRMLAFGIGLVALGFVVRRRLWWALTCVMAAGALHPTTALWFGGAVIAAAVAHLPRRSLTNAVLLAPLFLPLGAIVTYLARSPRLDPEWLAAIGDRAYLFPQHWPAYAWILNLAYVAVIGSIAVRRHRRGVATPSERAFVVGLAALAVGFLLSVPLAAMQIAPVVQLQVNRVFWVLDAVALIYVAWWLIDDRLARHPQRGFVVAALIVLSCVRGGYVLTESSRPLARMELADTEWTETLRWLREQPRDWLVLADAEHAWKFGASVRVAALRDTVLERDKDSSMAMYDRDLAMTVLERTRGLDGLDTMATNAVRDVGRRYHARVYVALVTQVLELPVLYRNSRFVVYDLQ